MSVDELRVLLEKAEDKLEVFKENEPELSGFIYEFKQLLKDYFNDEQIIYILEKTGFKDIGNRNVAVLLGCVKNMQLKSEFMKRTDLLDLGLYIENILISNSVEEQMLILLNLDIIKKFNISERTICDCICNLSEEIKQQILNSNIELLKEIFKNNPFYLVEIICTIQSEDDKLRLTDLYGLSQSYRIEIKKSLSEKTKKSIILNSETDILYNEIEKLIASIDTSEQLIFIREHWDYLRNKGVKLWNLVKGLKLDAQLQYVDHIEELGLTLDEKRQIFAALPSQAKSKVDMTNMPEEYVRALQLEEDSFKGNPEMIFNKDIEAYRGLDELFVLNPTGYSSEDRQRLKKLLEICPNIELRDNMIFNSSTATEYINGEAWIESVLSEISEDWTDIQKVAYIDYAIGKKISYSPDNHTERFSVTGNRSLWKIIDSGYGVCNGIANVEQYILGRVGIRAEMLDGHRHAFLVLKGIELPDENGDTVTGDTIIDPTWNLYSHRYGCMPQYFCQTYETVQDEEHCHDIGEEANTMSTIGLNSDTLKHVFKSIGLTDRDGNFPIKGLINTIEQIHKSSLLSNDKIKEILKSVENYCPEFATCNMETSVILEDFLSRDGINYSRCVVERVYDREDKEKKPVLYVYVDVPGEGRIFFYADKECKRFVEVSEQQFTERFECYDMDLEQMNGRRPWEEEIINEEKDINLLEVPIGTEVR